MVKSDWRRLRWIEDLSFCLGEGVMLLERRVSGCERDVAVAGRQ